MLVALNCLLSAVRLPPVDNLLYYYKDRAIYIYSDFLGICFLYIFDIFQKTAYFCKIVVDMRKEFAYNCPYQTKAKTKSSRMSTSL